MKQTALGSITYKLEAKEIYCIAFAVPELKRILYLPDIRVLHRAIYSGE
jgi:hypothetical protein